ncbi:hypothetical protein NA56DRAFT_130024 [Hyaloscypha hepaticicola]|uniref:Uncharacterized protein n=1 Tax=Hyaloscypha hepaticicola TaxID=2082293 RepID=A0A2J6Q463_9HELO|nr:hypothetical protein NA56DRAFT_130024 [Hyaloscypha hepaticicola]
MINIRTRPCLSFITDDAQGCWPTDTRRRISYCYCSRPRCGRIELPSCHPPARHARSADIGGVSPVDILLSTSRKISILLANKRGPTPTKLLSPCHPCHPCHPCGPWSPSDSIVAESKNHDRPRTSTPLVHVRVPEFGDHGFSFISPGGPAFTIPSLLLHQGKFLTSVVCVVSPPLSFMNPP